MFESRTGFHHSSCEAMLAIVVQLAEWHQMPRQEACLTPLLALRHEIREKPENHPKDMLSWSYWPISVETWSCLHTQGSKSLALLHKQDHRGHQRHHPAKNAPPRFLKQASAHLPRSQSHWIAKPNPLLKVSMSDTFHNSVSQTK